MKQVLRHRRFIKNYEQRIAPSPSSVRQFDKRVLLFLDGVRGYPLYDHSLSQNMKGLRSFSISGDLRVVYRETDDYYEFLAVGSHNQVYK